jgi:hypothetical protein
MDLRIISYQIEDRRAVRETMRSGRVQEYGRVLWCSKVCSGYRMYVAARSTLRPQKLALEQRGNDGQTSFFGKCEGLSALCGCYCQVHTARDVDFIRVWKDQLRTFSPAKIPGNRASDCL